MFDIACIDGLVQVFLEVATGAFVGIGRTHATSLKESPGQPIARSLDFGMKLEEIGLISKLENGGYRLNER
jgi:hypothetical protein